MVRGPRIRLTGYHRRIGLHTIVDGQVQRHGVLASLCIGEDEGIVAACCIDDSYAWPGIRLTSNHRRIGASHHC